MQIGGAKGLRPQPLQLVGWGENWPGVSVCPKYRGLGCLTVLNVWVQGVCPKYEVWGAHLP